MTMKLFVRVNKEKGNKETMKLFVRVNKENNLKLWNCLPMMQAKVGPTMDPGRGTSEMPADHMSMSSTLA